MTVNSFIDPFKCENEPAKGRIGLQNVKINLVNPTFTQVQSYIIKADLFYMNGEVIVHPGTRMVNKCFEAGLIVYFDERNNE